MTSTLGRLPRRRTRLAGLVATLSATCLALAACGGGDKTAVAADGTTNIKLSFEWTCEGNWPIAFLADQQGYFKDNKVSVKYVRGQGGSSTTPLIAQGEQDVGVLSAPPVVLGAGQGLPITVVGVAATESPVVILTDKSITGPAQLAGKKLAVQTDQFEGAVWKAFAAKSGLTGKVTVVPSDDAAEKQWLAGKIDALVDFYPTASTPGLMARPGGVNVIKMQDTAPNYGHTIVVNNKFLQKHGDAVKGFTKAWAQATQYAVAHPDQALSLLKSKCPELSPDVAKFTMDAYLAAYDSPYTKEHGFLSFDQAGLDQTEQLLVAGGLMKDKDISKLSTQDYLPSPAIK